MQLLLTCSGLERQSCDCKEQEFALGSSASSSLVSFRVRVRIRAHPRPRLRYCPLSLRFTFLIEYGESYCKRTFDPVTLLGHNVSRSKPPPYKVPRQLFLFCIMFVIMGYA